MSNKCFGYARVSSKDQNESRQLKALKECGIFLSQIYVDKQSGKDFDRPAYQRMLRKVKKGDLVVVKSIDRLGRNYNEILEQWRYITKMREVNILVLDMPLLDTRGRQDLMGTFISDLVLQILSYVAQTEREAIKQRQAEGIAAAKARGVRFGRQPNKLPENFPEVCKLYSEKQITVRQAAETLSMSPSTFHRQYKKAINEKM